MKDKIFIPLLVICFFSCKNEELTDRYIYFDSPQPANVEAVTSFPEKYQGTFALNYSNRLCVEPQLVMKINITSEETTLKKIDSIPEIIFKDKIVYNRKTKAAYHTIIKNDTIIWEIEHRDTLFSFAKNEIAKVYKSSLILNKESNGNYLVNIVKYSFSNNRYIQIGTKKDLAIIKKLKIPFTAETEGNDTLHVVLQPSRGDMRRLLREEGFEYDNHYYFK